MSEDDRKALHVGEHPADLSIREVGGWNSASEVKRAHYLTARIIWEFYPVQELLEESLESYGISSEVSSYVTGHLEEEDSEFPGYINDIGTKRGLHTSPGQATRLGSYTWTRHQQLAILNRSTSSPASELGASLGGRSLGLPLSMGVDGTVDSEGEFEMTDVSFSESLGDMDEVCEVADYSFAEYEDSPRSETENPVNIALMAFLSTLTIQCQRAKLDWDVNKKKFKFQLGNANFRTINDGCLRVRDNVLAVVEAKPFRLSENPEATLMQMGLEIMAHILDSHEKDYYIGKKYVPKPNTQASNVLT